LEAAVDIALRSAALETGAIEGLYATTRGVTQTVALQGAVWEAELDKLGADVRGHFEAQLSAFDLVLDVATNSQDISEAWVRRLHETVCAAQETYKVLTDAGWQDHKLPHGAYKTSANNVTLADGRTHSYARVTEVPPEMQRLTEEMRSDHFQSAHPVLQAGYAHHALTAIHPFADANGRVARALGSVFLYRAAGIPLVIFSDQQERYWDALAAADQGKPQAFVTFIDDRAIDTMALVTDRLREARAPLHEQVATIRRRFEAHGGLTHAEIQAVGQRLAQHLLQTFGQQFNLLDLRSDIFSTIEQRHGPIDCTFGGQAYHTLVVGGMFAFSLRCSEPVAVEVQTSPVVGISNETDNPFAFIVIDANRRSAPQLKLRVIDIHPSITSAAEARIEGWVKQSLSTALAELQRGIDAGLQSHGYSAR
jgi:Fic family protein